VYGLSLPGAPAPARAGLVINLNQTASLAANPDASAAFRRAADRWQAVFNDNINVNIDADLTSVGFANPNIIGSTSSVLLQGGYDVIRNQLVADEAAESSVNPLVAALPTAAQFTAVLPAGASLTANLIGTKADLKAMGFTGLDGIFGASDASIKFNSQFAFDYNNTNGVDANKIDFETVALHEIGHALGFVSVVDAINAGVTAVSPEMLDLFRFQDGGPGQDPATLADFTNFPRYLVPGGAAIFDTIANEFGLSTGLTPSSFPGVDGRQASHWKDDALTGHYIGIMDPTLDFGVTESITAADLTAFDLIGYDVVRPAAVPEPSSLALLGLLGLVSGGAAWRRRRLPSGP
jgi:hypothetical protein